MSLKTFLLAAMMPGLALAQGTIATDNPNFPELQHQDAPDLEGKILIYSDTVASHRGVTHRVERDSIINPHQVVTNKFGKNWFFFATGGAHTFQGDYSSDGKFSGTISPDWSVGVGKWFTPGVGLKLEFIKSDSRGYTEYLTGHYGYGPYLQKADGTPYRKMKTRWWDISGSVILNLTRLFNGYEGIDSRRHMNQFLVNIGIGGVHHLGYEHSHGNDNEWSGHLELQYSRFFTKGKRWSLDIKARGILYQTNFDLEYGQADHAAGKWDSNVGVDIGFTLYLGRRSSRGWGRAHTKYYETDYANRDILSIYQDGMYYDTNGTNAGVDYGTLVFYVFYPNNYSGRNDAPIVPTSNVNAIDYLTGGIFTQMRYADSQDVQTRLDAGARLQGLDFVNLPTEPANQDFFIDFVPRGYEMEHAPLSLPLSASAMEDFEARAGFFYAPIWDGTHTWQYRIDRETYGQSLLSDENYREDKSNGLNAHWGLPIVESYMGAPDNETLVSLADVYAALNSNEGFIAKYTDEATVARVKQIVENGVITLIHCEGLATSQDNYSGVNAQQVAQERNSALSQNRAMTVIKWLKQHPKFEEISSQIYLLNTLNNGIAPVTDTSTRGLPAKLNRCVRVKIHYMLP